MRGEVLLIFWYVQCSVGPWDTDSKTIAIFVWFPSKFFCGKYYQPYSFYLIPAETAQMNSEI